MGKRMLARLGAAVAGGALAFTMAAPALAAPSPEPTTDIDLKQDPTTAEDFETHECDNIFENKENDEDGWHFVVTQFTGEVADIEWFLNFLDNGDNPVQINNGNLGSFDHVLDWVGSGGGVAHLWLITPAGWTLNSASVTVHDEDIGENPQFNLSHTCPGEPGDDETPTPTPSEPSRTTPPGKTEPPDDDDELPVTGAQVGGMLLLAGGLLAAGVAMIAVRRRRSINDILEG